MVLTRKYPIENKRGEKSNWIQLHERKLKKKDRVQTLKYIGLCESAAHYGMGESNCTLRAGIQKWCGSSSEVGKYHCHHPLK
jgi:hypothetical protein